MSSIAHSVRMSIADLGRGAVDLLYPPHCAGCRMPLCDVGARSGSERFCGDCREILQCQIDHACLTCGAPVGPHLEMWGCRHCRKDSFAFERVVALGVYERQLQSCCKRIKDALEEPLAAGLSDLLWEAHETTLIAADIDLVVPIPHHWWERTTRRHLPPVTIGRILARRLSIPMATHILAKCQRTPAQSPLSPSRRRKNLREAFRIVGGTRLEGRNVLLTDDILTTGTTADRAARVLKEAGAGTIVVAVIARGLGRMANV